MNGSPATTPLETLVDRDPRDRRVADGALPLRSVEPTMMLDLSAAPPPLDPVPTERSSRPPTTTTVKLAREQDLRPSPSGVAAITRAKLPAPLPPPRVPRPVAIVRNPSPTQLRSKLSTRVRAVRDAVERAARAHPVAVGAALVVGLVSVWGLARITTQNTRWVAPTVLSSTDPRVLQVAATLQQETARKNELVLEKTELEARLREAKRWEALEEAFQSSFQAAVQSDLEARRAELRRLHALLSTAYAAHDVPLTKASSELQMRLGAVRQRIRVLEDALREARDGSYSGLALRLEYDRSVVGLDKTRELEAALVKAIAQVDEALAQKSALLASIEASPYALAVKGDVSLGFVPYDNRANVEVGASVLACKALLFCRAVGEVGELLPGEVRGTDPWNGKELRGQLVRLTLSDPRSAERSMLYARQKPL